jgi:hypothetical protein
MAIQIAARAAVRAAPGAAGVSVTNPAPCKRVGNLLIRNPQLRIVLLDVPSNYLERRRLAADWASPQRRRWGPSTQTSPRLLMGCFSGAGTTSAGSSSGSIRSPRRPSTRDQGLPLVAVPRVRRAPWPAAAGPNRHFEAILLSAKAKARLCASLKPETTVTGTSESSSCSAAKYRP